MYFLKNRIESKATYQNIPFDKLLTQKINLLGHTLRAFVHFPDNVRFCMQ